MKSRTSFFDKCVLKKDITRFAPLWALYLIGGLMIVISLHVNEHEINEWLGGLGIVSFGYAIVVAQLLFGDLFNTRLCNALHAMPLRREGWFFTHVTAGMLFSFVPNLLMALAMMLYLGKVWYTALIWLLGMEMHYIFFFGLAVFCMMLTGNRFAAAAVYGIINFLSMIVMWFATTVFLPAMYGVVMQKTVFYSFSPVVGLFQHQNFFTFTHPQTCWCQQPPYTNPDIFYYDKDHTYIFQVFGESWGYLAILTVLGIGLLIASLVLYRKRNLESAGDFIAFKGVKPVFTVIYTLCVGALLQMMGESLDVEFYIFLIIGLIVGYFTSQMLLNRSLRVFKKKNWLALVLFFVVVFGSLGLCRIDAFGLVRWTPDAEDVVSVKVADSTVGQFTGYNTDAEFTDKDSIEKLISVHKLLYAEGPTDTRDHYNGLQHVTICYTMKDGREIYRQYKATYDGEVAKAVHQMIFSNPVFLLRAESLEELLRNVQEVYVEGMEYTGSKMISLLTALWADSSEFTLSSSGNWWDKMDVDYMGYVQIVYKDGFNRSLDIFSINEHTTKWIKEELMAKISAQELKNSVSFFQIEDKTLEWDTVKLAEFCEIFAKDNTDGLIDDGLQANGFQVVIHFHTGTTRKYTVTEKAFSCYSWIADYLGYEQ